MLVHPWDAPVDDDEWRGWLRRHDFGQVIAPGDGRDLPVVVPTHFLYDGIATVWVHLARANPVWAALVERPRVLLTVVDDVTYVPAGWQAAPGTSPELGIPTSYYATVQLSCDARILDEASVKAELLGRQLRHFEPGGGYLEPDVEHEHYRRRLPGIRGPELSVTAVRAKFKYGGNKEPGHRELLADHLAERDGPADAAAREHLLRRHHARAAGASGTAGNLGQGGTSAAGGKPGAGGVRGEG